MTFWHAGMPDVPEHIAGIRYKEVVYKANEMPAMFIYPQDLQGPRWPETLIQRVDHLVEQASDRPDATRYNDVCDR